MRTRIYCRGHKRAQSLHAEMHCREAIKVGECLDARGNKRGERCPIFRTRQERQTLAASK